MLIKQELTTQARTFNIPVSHVIPIFLASFLNIFIRFHFHICLTTWPSFSGHGHMNTKLPIFYTTVTCVYKTCLELNFLKNMLKNISSEKKTIPRKIGKVIIQITCPVIIIFIPWQFLNNLFHSKQIDLHGPKNRFQQTELFPAARKKLTHQSLHQSQVKNSFSYSLKNLRISSTVVDHGKPRSFTT
jgi:hypothetical protein